VRRTLVQLIVQLLVAVLLALALGTAPAAARSDLHGKSQSKAEKKYAAQAFTATNANRTASGLRALKPQDCLQHAAVRQAKLMAQQEQIFHQDLGRVLRDCGLNTAGENVAYGYPTGRSVVNDGWMNSEGHRANILSTAFTLMGIGARKGHNGQWYVAQVFGRRS
jgi:uncharacterized protein YkwD